ncbi:MAG: hypothetical protein COT36_01600, partial [Parcubacteria group bacterium CG08_land_8_20_14_0_20_38_56]
NCYFTAKSGEKKAVIMGCYGFGLSRAMGAIVEIHYDKNGILWPKEVAPFDLHLIEIRAESSRVKKATEKVYQTLQKAGFEILYDDRAQKTAGEKFADADLIGIPLRIVISRKTLAKDSVEIKKRSEEKVKLVKITKLPQFLISNF